MAASIGVAFLRSVRLVTFNNLHRNGLLCKYCVVGFTQNRGYKELKKFYKNATVTSSEGWYEINLDSRKLRTPMGNPFRVPNEALALAVATEWNAQEDTVKRHAMHFTSLCNTALENPMRRTREDMIDSILHFLETDTICYRMPEPEDLLEFQKSAWDPIINWAEEKYGIKVHATSSISAPEIPPESIEALKKHLLSYSDWALFGFQYAVDTIKSVMLALAVVEHRLTGEEAVRLSRLEQEYQIAKWGNVEWHHDIDRLELQTRLAAATLFVQWCSQSTSIKQKASISVPT